MTRWLVDTGPIVALLCADDLHHEWAVEQSKLAPSTIFTCEAVISEVLFLLKRDGHDADPLFELVETGFLRCDFDFHAEYGQVRNLMHRYRGRPMAFADACLVRMSELISDSCIWTLDGDFTFYRKHGRRSISLMTP